MFEVNQYKPRYNVRLIDMELSTMPPEQRKKYEAEQSKKYIEIYRNNRKIQK